MTKRLEPYGGRIVVEKITEKERGGLIVPQVAQKRALIGRVLHVGPDVSNIFEGDIVLFAQYSGCSPYLDTALKEVYGEDVLIMNGEDILSYIREVEEIKTPFPAHEPATAGAD